MTSMTSCIVGRKIGGVGSGHLELFPFAILPRILKFSTQVHMTSMTSCIVGKKIGL